jgi:hypothetical protein
MPLGGAVSCMAAVSGGAVSCMAAVSGGAVTMGKKSLPLAVGVMMIEV